LRNEIYAKLVRQKIWLTFVTKNDHRFIIFLKLSALTCSGIASQQLWIVYLCRKNELAENEVCNHVYMKFIFSRCIGVSKGRPRGACPLSIFSISSHFVLWVAVS